MVQSQQKILQYLEEARASEVALVRVLQSQIAMTPRGAYRDALDTHLDETREHACLLSSRIRDLRARGLHPVSLAIGVTELVVGQALALAKTPLDLVRGSGGDEKVLKNAKDSVAAEALEIATYTALERLALLAGDDRTADLARGILADERRMLDRLLTLLPELTEAMYAAEVHGRPAYDPAETGVADAVRHVRDTAVETAEHVTESVAASASDVKRTVGGSASQVEDLAREVAAEVLEADEGAPDPDTDPAAPWPSYDESSVEEVRAILLTADDEMARQVEAYERKHAGRDELLELVARS